jgi:hypothetical protein
MFLCPSNMFCTVQVPVYALSMFQYLYCSCSGTRIAGHPILQVIRYQKVLQSTGTCTVIWYPHSMSSNTLYPVLPLRSSGTNLCLFRYQLHPVPDCAYSGTSSIQYYHHVGLVPIVMIVFIRY